MHVRSLGPVGLVLTLAFVFASSSLLLAPVAAQSSPALYGTICTQGENYPKPMPAGSGGSSQACWYGSALPGASVRLSRPGLGGTPVGGFDQTVTSDANGQYSFSGLQTGEYTLAVSRTGFAASSETIQWQSGSVQHDVALVGQAVDAKGLVQDPSDNPISGAEVQLCCGSGSQVNVKTASDGRFNANVTAGYWSLYVQAPGFQAASDYLLIDGASDILVEMQPIPPTDATVQGIVRDQDGNPVEGVRVAVYMYGGCYYSPEDAPAGESGSGSAEPAPASMPPCYDRPYYGGENYTLTSSDGRYSLGVYSGEGSLSVQKDGYASYSMTVRVASGETQTQDLTIKKFPAKTATIVGQVTSAGKGIPYAYLSVNSPEYGIYECSSESGAGTSGSSGSADSVEPARSSLVAPGHYGGCAITMNADGSFEGKVTPGYAIVSVWVDSYRSCAETRDADGSSSTSCGPEYYSWSKSVQLPADATTRIDISLRSRPAPDAVVSGYLVDAESGKAIPGARIQFSNQDTYGYGYATTDQDGSYKLRLRSGYHNVYAYAEGHLHWEGVLDVKPGDMPFDVQLVPGQESYGYCCYGYDTVAAKEGGSAPEAAPSPVAGAPSSGSGSDAASSGQDAQADVYEDLGGGLGPYDAEERQRLLSEGGDGDSNGAPSVGLPLLAAALASLAFALRRRKA